MAPVAGFHGFEPLCFAKGCAAHSVGRRTRVARSRASSVIAAFFLDFACLPCLAVFVLSQLCLLHSVGLSFCHALSHDYPLAGSR